MVQCSNTNKTVGQTITFKVQPIGPSTINSFTGRIYRKGPGQTAFTEIKYWIGIALNAWSTDWIYFTTASDIGNTVFKATVEYSKTGCTSPIVSAEKTCTFTISSTTTNSITVTSPNGGETWQRGTSKNVTWSTSGTTGSTVKIELMKAGVVVGTIIASTPNDGIYTWGIAGSGSTGNDYKVKISSIGYPSITDTSNANFTISSGTVTPKWKCSGSPNYTCSRDDVNGTYLSQTACQSACHAPIIISDGGATEEADNTWIYIIAGIILLYILAEG